MNNDARVLTPAANGAAAMTTLAASRKLLEEAMQMLEASKKLQKELHEWDNLSAEESDAKVQAMNKLVVVAKEQIQREKNNNININSKSKRDMFERTQATCEESNKYTPIKITTIPSTPSNRIREISCVSVPRKASVLLDDLRNAEMDERLSSIQQELETNQTTHPEMRSRRTISRNAMHNSSTLISNDDAKEDNEEEASSDDSYVNQLDEDEIGDDDDAQWFDLTGSGMQLLTAPPELLLQLRTMLKPGAEPGSPPNRHSSAASGERSEIAGQQAVSRATSPPPPPIEYVGKKGYILKMPSDESSGGGSMLGFRTKRKVVRWFEVFRDKLVYYKSGKSRAFRGIFKLANAHVKACKSNTSPTGIHLYVHLNGGERKLVHLCPKTEVEALEWVAVLENNIACVAQEEEEEEASVNEQANRNKQVHARENLRRRSRVGWDVAQTNKPAISTHYDVLGVDRTAMPNTIKKAYYKLARDNHPDKTESSDTTRFAAIQASWEVLQDEETRANYDMRERVKLALRHGVMLNRVPGVEEEVEGLYNRVVGDVVVFVDEAYGFLFFQESKIGQVLGDTYSRIELRFVQAVVAGEDREVDGVNDPRMCLQIEGEKLENKTTVFELDTHGARDELLDGLRQIRLSQSVLFKKKLDELKAKGFR